MNWVYFLRHCHRKDLQKRERREEVENKVKTVALFVAANGSKVCDLIVVSTSKKLRCFKKLKNIYRPMESIISPMLKLG